MKILIVGLGSIGRRHLNNLIMAGYDDIILYRTGHSTIQDNELSNFHTETDLAKAFSYNPQVVIICNPTALHLQVAIEAAQFGCDLLIEKPLSHTFERVDRLLKLVTENKVVAVVGYVLRYDLGAIKFKDWLSNKLTGIILHARIECGSYLPDWRQDQDIGRQYLHPKN